MVNFIDEYVFYSSFIIGGLIILYINRYNLSNSFRSDTKFINSEDDGIKETIDLFNKSKTLVKIVGGELNSKFYNNSLIIESIKNALERNVRFEIICGPTLDERNTELFKLIDEYPDKIYLYFTEKREVSHCRVLDDRYI